MKIRRSELVSKDHERGFTVRFKHPALDGEITVKVSPDEVVREHPLTGSPEWMGYSAESLRDGTIAGTLQSVLATLGQITEIEVVDNIVEGPAMMVYPREVKREKVSMLLGTGFIPSSPHKRPKN
jgi:hypothetical protein